MTSSCVRYYKVQSNNDYYYIAQHTRITLDAFYSWNLAIKSDCSGLQSGVFVSVGVSGYETTITLLAYPCDSNHNLVGGRLSLAM